MNSNIVKLLFWGCLSSVSAAYGLEQGEPFPDCYLTPLSGGQPVPLRQFQGQVLYVDFWASWCAPCAKSFPFLNTLHAKYQAKGLKIIGVNVDETVADAKAFLVQFPPQFTVVADKNQQCAEAFAVKAMPSSYLIDRHGAVRHIHLGFKSDAIEQLDRVLVQLLTEP